MVWAMPVDWLKKSKTACRPIMPSKLWHVRAVVSVVAANRSTGAGWRCCANVRRLSIRRIAARRFARAMRILIFKLFMLTIWENRVDRVPTSCCIRTTSAQGIFGYLPREVQEIIAGRLHIPVSKVYGVVTFYSFFTMTPKGKYPISVCLGTACYVRGAEKVLEEFQRQLEIKVGETTSDGLFSLDCLRCVGACGLAPVVTIAGKVYGRLTPEKVRDILSEYYLLEQV